MLDFEALCYQLLTRSLPDITIRPEHEVDEVDGFPIIMFTISGGNQLAGIAGKPLAWDANLSLSVFDTSLDSARALAGRAYDAVWAWDDPFALPPAGLIDELGHAAEIEDQSVFTRVGTADIGDSRFVTQYDGRFGLQLHSA